MSNNYDTTDEIILEETQKAAYEEQCLHDFIHQEQPNEDYFEGINDYIDETMSIWNSHFFRRLLVICEEEAPYTEGVLFHNGFELTCTEPDCTYDGEWNFEHNGIEYTVLVEIENWWD